LILIKEWWLLATMTHGRWPVKAPYPLAGALLPYNRIIAYYGNLYSTRMGILGELSKRNASKITR
jgi:hypothetical protein